jgi:hypothetical protein
MISIDELSEYAKSGLSTAAKGIGFDRYLHQNRFVFDILGTI